MKREIPLLWPLHSLVLTASASSRSKRCERVTHFEAAFDRLLYSWLTPSAEAQQSFWRRTYQGN